MCARSSDCSSRRLRTWSRHGEMAATCGLTDEVTDLDLTATNSTAQHARSSSRACAKGVSEGCRPLEGDRIVPESMLVLQSIKRGQDGLYLQAMDGGLGRLKRLGNDYKLVDVALPFDGMLAGLSADPATPGAVMLLVRLADADWSVVGRRGWPSRRC